MYLGRRQADRPCPSNPERQAPPAPSFAMPDAKQWWRNFLGTGGPISLNLDGVDRAGHAVASRDDRGRVTVTVDLTR